MRLMDILHAISEIPIFVVDIDGAPTAMHRNVDVINALKGITTKSVKYYDESEAVWKVGEVIVDE